MHVVRKIPNMTKRTADAPAEVEEATKIAKVEVNACLLCVYSHEFSPIFSQTHEFSPTFSQEEVVTIEDGSEQFWSKVLACNSDIDAGVVNEEGVYDRLSRTNIKEGVHDRFAHTKTSISTNMTHDA